MNRFLVFKNSLKSSAERERLSVDCQTFGEPVIRVDLEGNSATGPGSTGTQMSLRPPSWQNKEIMSATLAYSVYFPEGHEFIQNEVLPGFYSDGPTGDFRNFRLKIRNGNIILDTSKCDFCQTLNELGNLGSVTNGQECSENF